MEADEDFPRLTTENHRVTSPAMIDYNCIAWAAGDTERWWEPGVFWPIESPPDNYGIGILEAAFKSLGFEACDGEEPEPGFEKNAIYGNNLFYMHAAKQLPTGKWTSKLGKLEDIEHDTPDVVAGGVYGEVVGIMRRPESSE